MLCLRHKLLPGIGFVALVASGCGGASTTSPSSTAPTSGPPVLRAYAGTVAVETAGKSASIFLLTSVPTTIIAGAAQQAPTGTVTGIISTIDGAKVSVAGTITNASGVVTVQSGAYAFTGTVDSNRTFNGSGYFSGGAGLLASRLALTSGATPLAVTAAAWTRSSTPAVYCGSYAGQYVASNGKNETEGAALCFTINGNTVSGSAPASGEILPGSPAVIYFAGTVSGGSFSARATNGNPGVGFRLDGTFGFQWSGSYSGYDEQGFSSGSWQASGNMPPPDSSPAADIPANSLGN
jgi:hypothetical protein